MAERRASLRERWQQLQVTKTVLVWACVGSAALTMVVGFGFGGWVTGGKAATMARDAGNQAQAELAATICVERFRSEAGSQVQLAALKEIDGSFRQRAFIADGGWATMPGMDRANSAAAALCAERLASAE